MLTSILAAAEPHSEEAAINPYIIGAVALAIMLSLLFALLAFGKGREHT